MQLSLINRYPVKSFQTRPVQSAHLDQTGIYGDRVFALRDPASGKILSGKHATLGEAIMALEAEYDAEPEPGSPLPPVTCRINGAEVAASDTAALLEALAAALGTNVELASAGQGEAQYDIYWLDEEYLPLQDTNLEFPLALAEAGSFADLEPLHVLTSASLEHIAALTPDSQMSVDRFRPSLYIDTPGQTGFIEHDWEEGRTATLGEAQLTFGGATPRCNMVTRPQCGLPRDVGVLRSIAQQNMREILGAQLPALGCYATVTRPGRVELGDTLVFD